MIIKFKLKISGTIKHIKIFFTIIDNFILIDKNNILKMVIKIKIIVYLILNL